MSDAPGNIRELIDGHERHFGYEDTYFREAFVDADVPAVAAGIVELLRTGDRELVWPVVDFTIQAVIRNVAPAFNDYLPQSGVFGALRELLYAPDHNVRHNVVYAFGKMCYRENIPVLLEALPSYLARYPLELPGRFFELIWLSPTFR